MKTSSAHSDRYCHNVSTPSTARPVFSRFYDPAELDEAIEAERVNSRRLPTLDRMRQHGPDRELAIVTSCMIDDLSHLADAQPNCVSALDYIRRQLALSRLAAPPTLRCPPILLEGPPGVGKTHFAQALARKLGHELTIINCSTVTAGFVLSGNNPSWHESRPGKIVETLVGGRFANPIILLDEVDKLAGDARFGGYGPLYQLLEERTARCFIDEHVGLPIDASNIIWIATANDARALPDPIRSRFNPLSITAPNAAQAQAVVQSVYRELIERDFGWCVAFAPDLTPAVAMMMTDIPPRQMRQVLLSAMGHVALTRPEEQSNRLFPDVIANALDIGPHRIIGEVVFP